MGNVERYETLLRSALEVQQLKIELKRKLAEVAKNITANELKHRRFDQEDAKKAFLILEENTIKIKDATYVKSIATYKDLNIELHSKSQDLGGNAMAHVLGALTNNEIFET